MRPKRIISIYFSPTLTTKKIVITVADSLAYSLRCGDSLRENSILRCKDSLHVNNILRCNDTLRSNDNLCCNDSLHSNNSLRCGDSLHVNNILRCNDTLRSNDNLCCNDSLRCGDNTLQTTTCLRLEYDITTPEKRELYTNKCTKNLEFSKDDIIIFGAPVYIGRMPNLISPYFSYFKGNNALAIPVVLYGNRNYDDGLIELRDILEKNGFHTIAAGAFIGEHSFSTKLAKRRPDDNDINIAMKFGKQIAEIISNDNELYNRVVDVKGNPYPYKFFNAIDKNNNKIDIRKVKPKTDISLCNNCVICARVCPMGAIERDNCTIISGICIKCGACIKRCPKGAKYFDDIVYIEHLKNLEETYGDIRREPEIFLKSKNEQ